MESFDLVFSTHIHFAPDVVDQIGATPPTPRDRVLLLTNTRSPRVRAVAPI